MGAWLVDLGQIRRALLTLAILFFTVMLLEVDLGHAPALARHSWLALLPVAWLPVTLFALMAVQIKPALLTMWVSLAATAIAAAIGMIGAGLHMLAAGVDLEHLQRVFSSGVWGGHESPNWPVAITLAGVIGFAGSINAHRNAESQQRDLGSAAAAVAYVLIVVGIVISAIPVSTIAGPACLTIAALLLLAVLIAILTGTVMERSPS